MKLIRTKMDFLVLAVVLALIAGVFVKARMVRQLPQNGIHTCQIMLIDPEETIAERIIPGDTVICQSGKQPVGTVTEVQIDGTLIVVTVEIEGYPIDGGIRANIYDILPGFRQRFYTETAYWMGVVTAVH